MQWYLAVKSRVEWGGFGKEYRRADGTIEHPKRSDNEADQLPHLYASLSPEDKATVDDRLAGKIVT